MFLSFTIPFLHIREHSFYTLKKQLPSANDPVHGSSCKVQTRAPKKKVRKSRRKRKRDNDDRRKRDTIARERIVSRSLANESYVRFGYGNTAFQRRHLYTAPSVPRSRFPDAKLRVAAIILKIPPLHQLLRCESGISLITAS